MSQSTFNVDPGPGQAGQLASSADHQFNAAKVDEAGGIASGLFVVRGANPEEASLPAAETDITDADNNLGFAYLDPSKLSPVVWPDNRQMTYLEKGEIYAVSETAVTAGDPVEVRYAGAGTIGAVRSVNVPLETAALPNAVFVKTTSAAGIAVVKFYR